MDIIRRPENAFDRHPARVALLAALLHDVGHGPFSHVFENVGKALKLRKRHEDWGREIIEGDTEVNCILRSVDEQLPKDVAALLIDDLPKDIYATVVSSQMDADRLDYLQRDRLMTGVQFGHVDRDWLFDCMQVGEMAVEANTESGEPGVQIPCLYLNHKGIQVGEEYLEARLRMYTMVYMHKTTRAAEMMLGELLRIAVKSREGMLPDPLRSYFASSSSDALPLQLYLSLDDYTIWAALSLLQSCANSDISLLAGRILNRNLYKCFDLGHLPSDSNVHLQFGKRVNERFGESEFLHDNHAVQLYKSYKFDVQAALNKILVKPKSTASEPQDIVSVSKTIQALRDQQFSFWRLASLSGALHLRFRTQFGSNQPADRCYWVDWRPK